MKKLVVVLAIAFIVGLLVSACHGQKKCPAYSKAEDTQTETTV